VVVRRGGRAGRSRHPGLRVQVFDYPPGAHGPEHDETSSGKEELYVGLAGAGWIEIEGEPIPIEARVVIAVQPGARRRPLAGPSGLSLMCVGGVVGEAYQPMAKFEP
jgi:quercetin dioxygenase-like cupin family protein